MQRSVFIPYSHVDLHASSTVDRSRAGPIGTERAKAGEALRDDDEVVPVIWRGTDGFFGQVAFTWTAGPDLSLSQVHPPSHLPSAQTTSQSHRKRHVPTESITILTCPSRLREGQREDGRQPARPGGSVRGHHRRQPSIGMYLLLSIRLLGYMRLTDFSGASRPRVRQLEPARSGPALLCRTRRATRRG